MLHKSVVDKFLNRELIDHNKYKKYSLIKLERLRKLLPVRPPIWKKLRKEQKVCLLLGIKYESFAFFLDTGLGKSLLSIALHRYFKKVEKVRNSLVLAPNRINLGEWSREVKKHSPNTKCVILRGSTKKKLETLAREEGPAIFVATYGGFSRMCCARVEANKKKKKQGRKLQLKPDKKVVDLISKKFQAVFADESSFLGSRHLCWRICKKLTKDGLMLFDLSGTPFNKDPLPLWYQMNLVDDGETLGRTVEIFREAFYNKKKNHFSGFYDFIFDNKKRELIHKTIRNRSIRYPADESTLPKVVANTKVVPMSSEARMHYNQAQEDIRNNFGNVTFMRNKFIRMRQISSGFIGFEDDDIGKKAQLEFKHNPKLESLLSSAAEIAPHSKGVIYCVYVYTGMMICRELKKLGIKHERIYGGTKDPEGVRDRFEDDDECRFLVMNDSAGGYGLNLQFAKYGLIYETPTSPRMRKQIKRRIERQYSKFSNVFFTDFVVKGTYDEDILESLAQGQDFFNHIIEGKKRAKELRAGSLI